MSKSPPSRRSWRQLAAGAVLAFGIVVACTAPQQPAADLWWPGYGNGADNSRYFASQQISKSNINQLQVAWSYAHGDTGSVPIAVRGKIYGRGRNGSLVAVDAGSGAELWVRENMHGMTSRGINYWENADGSDQRLIFAMDGLLQEVDAKTGESILSFGTNGVVDLKHNIDGRDPESIGVIQSNTPGEVFENLIILGSAMGELYLAPPGDIRAYDVLSGELVWTFHTVPRPGEFGYDTWPKDAWQYVGGNNAWGELTVDAELGIAYVPLGSPTYDFYGADRPGANLFGTSLVALDARSGERIWHFQLVHHDLWDQDPNSAPQLATIRHAGQDRDVVALAGKTGWLYVFDRKTGEPIWPIEERPVPQSDMEGEQSWPTQPYPTNPPPFAKQSFTVEDISPYLPADEAEEFRARLAAAKNLGLFTPISRQDTVHAPTHNGGSLFGGTAAEPGTGAVYIVTRDNPGILRLVTPEEKASGVGRSAHPGQRVYEQNCEVCHGADRLGTDNGAPLIADGTLLFDAAAIRAVLKTGNGRMPAFPHLGSFDVDRVVAYLAAPTSGNTAAPGSGAPPELIAGSGSAWTRPALPNSGTTREAPPYPDGTPDWERYLINEYNTVGYRIRPPFASIVKYDLNKPDIEWSIGFGDDPMLAAQGVTGTGAPGLRHGIVVTAAGIVFGAGRDNRIRAWDSDTGEPLWSSEFGGNFVGAPLMYRMAGREYLLVPAAGTPASQQQATTAPLGWVAYALPLPDK